MISLPSILGALTAILQAYPLCKKVAVVETKEVSSDQFFFKVRMELPGKKRLQIRVYYNRGHIDYAYQLFADVPLLRWDNKEEFNQLASYPHHHHDEQGNVKPSPLAGEPIRDIEIVLQEISVFLRRRLRDDG